MSETGPNLPVRQRFVCEPCGLNVVVWLCEHFSPESRIAEVERELADQRAETNRIRDILAAERGRFAREAVPARIEQRHWEEMRGERDRLRAEVARLRESEPLTYRGQRDAALREIARLEALIVDAVVSGPGHVPDCIYNECRNIRNRKGESSC